MVKQQYILSIPTPCDENWDKMTPTEKGRFCQVCNKNVFDFTAYSDHQLLDYIKNNGNICGRLNSTQLNRPIISYQNSPGLLTRASTILAFMSSSLAVFSQNTEKPNTEVKTILVEPEVHQNEQSNPKDSSDVFISGKVKDSHGEPLPFAKVLVLGNYRYRQLTDENGDFILTFKAADEPLKIQISYTGYQTKVIDVEMKYRSVILDDVILEDSHMTLGGAVVMTPISKSKQRKNKRALRKEEKRERKKRK